MLLGNSFVCSKLERRYVADGNQQCHICLASGKERNASERGHHACVLDRWEALSQDNASKQQRYHGIEQFQHGDDDEVALCRGVRKETGARCVGKAMAAAACAIRSPEGRCAADSSKSER